MARNFIGPLSGAGALTLAEGAGGAGLINPGTATIGLLGAPAFALWHSYHYPEQTAYSRGVARAQEEARARAARQYNQEVAQNRAEAIAFNKALADYYAKELTDGELVIEGNGWTRKITGYDPTNGTITARVDYPSGSYMQGTFPETNYRPIDNPRDLAALSNVEIVYPNKGRYVGELDYIDYNTQNYVPGQLIESYIQPIAQNLPSSFFTMPGPKQLPLQLSTGRVVTLPITPTDFRVFDESVDPGAGEAVKSGAKTGTDTGGETPRRNDDDDDKDNQISTVEEYIRRFGKNMSRRTARRIRKSERISHDANGNVNHRATKLLNRGVNAGTEGAKSGGFPWQTLLFGTSLGVGATLGTQAIFGGEEEVKDPDPHGNVTHTQKADSLINQAMQLPISSEQTETTPIQGEKIDWSKIEI